MEYDYSLIGITKDETLPPTAGPRVDASLFIENYWGKDALSRTVPSDPRIEELFSQPFTEEYVPELQKAYGDMLVALHAPAPPALRVEPPPEAAPDEVPVELVEPKPSDALLVDVNPTKAEAIRGMQFALHSVVRGRANRTVRAAGPTHHRFRQHVTTDQIRLVRGRPVPISGAKVLTNLAELRKKEEAGILEVRTLHGQRLLHLRTLDVAPSANTPPLPRRLPDSAVRDANTGIGEFIPPFDGAVEVKPSASDPDAAARIPPTIPRQPPPAPPPVPGIPPAVPAAKKKDKPKEPASKGRG